MIRHLAHDHLELRCRVLAPRSGSLGARSDASSPADTFARVLGPALIVGSSALAFRLPPLAGALCVAVGCGVGAAVLLVRPDSEAARGPSHRWVTIEVRGDQVQFEGREVALKIEKDVLEVNGDRLWLDPPLSEADLAVVRSTVHQAVGLRQARSGGVVPDDLVRLRREAEQA